MLGVENNKPHFEVPIRYLMICRTARKWNCCGICINFLIVCATREIYGLVIVTKIRLQTNF